MTTTKVKKKQQQQTQRHNSKTKQNKTNAKTKQIKDTMTIEKQQKNIILKIWVIQKKELALLY